MINQEFQLKLQAYLDGELSASEAADIRSQLAGNGDARSLLAELQNTVNALAGHEQDIKLPESREFFWSKIQREIEGRSPAPVINRPFSLAGWFKRRLVPISGFAVVVLVLLLVIQLSPGSNLVGEIELSSNDMGVMTFRHQKEKMTFVWLYDKSDSGFTGPASLASVDPNE
jgi:hypothetical protein